jgi:putative ATPase
MALSGRMPRPSGLVPPHLRDGHYSGAAGSAQGYKYSHDEPDGIVPQQYLSDEIGTRLEKLRAIIRRKRG